MTNETKMMMRVVAALFLLASSLCVSSFAQAPLAPQSKPMSSHAPFEAGDCKICHQNADPKNPGPVAATGVALCSGCHEDFTAIMARPHVHRVARKNCMSCHNPHNAKNPKLLTEEASLTCTKECHDDIGKAADAAKVKHKAVFAGAKCTGCHNPHASSVAKLLVAQPSELCLSCHNVDTLVGVDGKKLQNTKSWLAKNPDWHAPVQSKDCGACHVPHGGDHFRLLKEDYPKEFYAPYNPRAYALCFSCHQEKAYSTAKTTTLTGFRDGELNLHFLHLQQSGRGRTCRACHEVHASTQKHHIREGVPYGAAGWVLKLNFKTTATGGSCAKTCHQEKAYSNKTPG
ncbi:MAG: cytochrome c3 family protein [Rubrivivax sp.]|nr:cytochrome c3 family protein [Rubrivivax sp.]